MMANGTVMPSLAFCSVEETCQRLTISKAFFYLLVKRGRIRIVKLGRRTLVATTEIQRLMEAQALPLGAAAMAGRLPESDLHEVRLALRELAIELVCDVLSM